MKAIFILFVYWCSATTFGQTIILGGYPQTVPQGKKWILPTNKEILVEVSDGTLNSGSLCNANILSNPRIVGGIVEGEYGRPNEVYGILFKDLLRVPYANNYTYKMTPISIVNSKFNIKELRHKDFKEVGTKQITFYPGQKVYVTVCLHSIQLIETNLTEKELSDIKKRETEIKLFEQQQKLKDDYINSSALINTKELKLSVQPEALEILYDYIQEFKKTNSEGWYNKLNSNVQARLSPGKDDDYSLLSFSIYFDELGRLNKISNDAVVDKDKDYDDIDLDIKWFEKLKPLISLNKSGVIKKNNKDFVTKSKCLAFFDFRNKSTENHINISVGKKNEITITGNYSGLSNQQVLEAIKKNEKIFSFKNGDYTVIISKDVIQLYFTHFQLYGDKEIISTEKQVNTITSIK